MACDPKILGTASRHRAGDKGYPSVETMGENARHHVVGGMPHPWRCVHHSSRGFLFRDRHDSAARLRAHRCDRLWPGRVLDLCIRAPCNVRVLVRAQPGADSV